jgi:hypothetical protein
LDGETAFEAIRELETDGPFKWEAVELLETEVRTSTELRAREKLTILRCLKNLPEEHPRCRRRRIEFIKRRLKRTVGYREHLVELTWALICR